jgi:diketogulonate reductase-like aldo/keto reductase
LTIVKASGVVTALAALRRGLDLGLTHIDTAEYYGWAPPRRDDVFLVSKIVRDHASRNGAIRKAVTPQHAVENAGTINLRLAEKEIARIDAAFPLERAPQALP